MVTSEGTLWIPAVNEYSISCVCVCYLVQIVSSYLRCFYSIHHSIMILFLRASRSLKHSKNLFRFQTSIIYICCTIHKHKLKTMILAMVRLVNYSIVHRQRDRVARSVRYRHDDVDTHKSARRPPSFTPLILNRTPLHFFQRYSYKTSTIAFLYAKQPVATPP